MGLRVKGWQNASMASIRHALAPALLLATLAVTPAVAQEEAVELPEGFSQKMADRVTEVIEAVPPIRRLPAAESVAYEVVDSEAFLARLQDKLREDYPAEYIEAEENAF